MTDAFVVTPHPLDPMLAVSQVAADDAPGAHGAVATFIGLVRANNLGRQVERLEYEAHAPLAVRAFERIAAESAREWPTTRVAIHHRTGVVEIGEASVVIAAASPHRPDAFRACRYAIERLKQIAPIWKREHLDEGEVWLDGAIADPDDDAARQHALRVACG